MLGLSKHRQLPEAQKDTCHIVAWWLLDLNHLEQIFQLPTCSAQAINAVVYFRKHEILLCAEAWLSKASRWAGMELTGQRLAPPQTASAEKTWDSMMTEHDLLWPS